MKNPEPGSHPCKTTVAGSGEVAGDGDELRLNSPSIRNELRPGDLGALIHLHGTLYAAECGWDHTFEAYVAGPLSEFVREQSSRDCIWIVEHQGQVAGSIAVVQLRKKVAQLRWFLLHPRLRGQGLGRLLLQDAISFSRKSGYARIELWTARNLTTAAHLYRSAGFELSKEITHPLWGKVVTEQQYDLWL